MIKINAGDLLSPSLRAKFSNHNHCVLFKFLDYFASVGRRDVEPIIIDKPIDIEILKKDFYDYKIDIDLKKLIKASPLELAI